MTLFSTAVIRNVRCYASRRIRPPPVPLPTRITQHDLQVRSHMNHGAPGGHDHHHHHHSSQPGFRTPVSLGLEAAQSTSNILRLLETSHGGYLPRDALASVWHSQGLLWEQRPDHKWVATNPTSPQTTEAKAKQAPQLLSLSLSDDRTALVKLIGVDGRTRFVSLLRLDAEFLTSGKGMGMGMGVPNDGWMIVREFIAGTNTVATTNHDDNISTIKTLSAAIHQYLSIEHGGGPKDKKIAQQLFHPDASLLSIGTLPNDTTEASSEWNGPVGSLVEISLDTYVQGVASQTPHEDTSQKLDCLKTLDVSACGTMAAATVQVGNGAQTTLFEDYLLLGRSPTTKWQILSKIFSPRAWK